MIAAITCRFNPARFVRPVMNFEKFKKAVQNQADLFVIDLSYGDEPSSTPDAFVKLRTNSVMWHKENLLGILEKSLPSKYDTIAWLDSDILIPDGWCDRAEERLEKLKLVQLFSSVDMLNESFDVESSCVSSSAVFNKTDKLRNPGIKGHPGLGWVARREFFEKVGLFDFMVLGGGDEMVFYSAMGLIPWFAFDRFSPDFRSLAVDHVRKSYNYVQAEIGFVDQKICHMWHGRTKSRRYLSRQSILTRVSSKTVHRRGDGLIEWDEAGADLIEDVKNYFNSRNEDAHDDDNQPKA